MLLLAASSVQAVHGAPQVFEVVDGDPHDGAGPGDDWSNVFHGTSGAAATVFVSEATEHPDVDTTYFAGGHSKDTNDLDQWQVNGNSAPAKGEILNAGAAYYHSDDAQLLYFFLDRLSTNGDSAAGFWFLKSSVDVGPEGTLVNATGDPAKHSEGDVLVVTEFTQGGTVGSLSVYSWTGGALVLQDEIHGADVCGGVDGIDQACATTNADIVPAAWPYSGSEGDGAYETNAFLEGGVDFGAIFGHEPVCFSSFIAETRTSQETTAVLSDLAFGNFRSCDARISISPQEATNDVGDPHEFTITVEENDGLGWGPGGDGIQVQAELLPGSVGGFVGDDSCTTVAGTCTITIVSSEPGESWVNVSATVDLQGRPKHVSTSGFDGNSGPAHKIWIPVNGTITIVKQSTPADGSDFQFDASWLEGAFLLDDDGDTDDVLPDRREFSVRHGSYQITEAQLPHWHLTGLVCEESGEQDTVTDLEAASVNINVGRDETVTCTFTNTKDARISVSKRTVPELGAQSPLFSFTGDIQATLRDGGSAEAWVPAGIYEVSETPTDGFDLTAISCGLEPIDHSTTTATFDVSPGDDLACTFTNTQRATVTVTKDAFPADGTTFSFDSDFSDQFQLSDGGVVPDSRTWSLPPGSYHVAEVDLPPFWSLVDLTCDGASEADGEGGVAFAVEAGGSIECTFDNTRAVPTTITTTPGHENIGLGSSITDFATVTGADEAAPSGSVDFYLCSPSETADFGQGRHCPADQGTFLGTVALDENGRATSPSATPDLAGVWCFRADYSGSDDGVYGPSTETDPRECFEVDKATPSVVTLPTAAEILLGHAIQDQAQVTGLGAPFPAPVGSISFYACDPANVTIGIGCEPDNGTFVGTADLISGSALSPEFTPDTNGTWCFRAVYSGDDNHESAHHTSLAECFDVLRPAMLTLSKETPSEGEKITQGAVVTYNITYHNPGDAAAYNVIVTDKLVGLDHIVCQPKPCGQTPPGSVTWLIGTVPGGASGKLTFDAYVIETDSCFVCNHATILGQDADGVQIGPVASNEVCFCVQHVADPDSSSSMGSAQAYWFDLPALGVVESAYTHTQQDGEGIDGPDANKRLGTSNAALQAGVIYASSISSNDVLEASHDGISYLADVDISIGGTFTLTADVLRSEARATATGSHATASTEGSLIAGLVINGVPVVDIRDNMVIPLPAAAFGAGSHVTLFATSADVSVPDGPFGGRYVATAHARMVEIVITDLGGSGSGVTVILADAQASAGYDQVPVCDGAEIPQSTATTGEGGQLADLLATSPASTPATPLIFDPRQARGID